MQKQKVTNLSAVIVPYHFDGHNLEILVDQKDNGYPIVHIREKLCPVGGNWVGASAAKDKNPQDTAIRELNEEMSIAKQSELVDLGFVDEGFESDAASLNLIKQYIVEHLVPLGDYLNITPKVVWDRDDSTNTRNGGSYLSSYYGCQLDQSQWAELKRLLKKYNNLSNESQTVIISFDDIINKPLYGAFGHDTFLRDFCASFNLDTSKFPMVEGIERIKLSNPTANNYQYYLENYDIEKKP